MGKRLCIKSACDMLLRYGRLDLKEELKRHDRLGMKAALQICKKALWQFAVPQDPVSWPTGLLAAGLWHRFAEFKDGTEDSLDAGIAARNIEAALDAYFVRWQRKGFPVAYVDDLLAGEVFLDMYSAGMAGNEEITRSCLLFMAERLAEYRKAADKLAAYALSYPRDRNGCLSYRDGRRKGLIYVDAIGLCCPFLHRYGTLFGNDECRELALRQIESFFSCGMDGATGLPYHGYEVESGTKYGVIGWGRAVGWLLRGMHHCMDDGYGAERLGRAFRNLIDAILPYQREDGSFSWQLQASEGPSDTSAAGLICVALQAGIENGVLEGAEYRRAIALGLEAIRGAIEDGLVHQCSGECGGFGCYPQVYGAYPWSLGPALMLDIEAA